ncbi:MAG: polyprenyl synthetase family protein [Bdellovibrionota bacterium]
MNEAQKSVSVEESTPPPFSQFISSGAASPKELQDSVRNVFFSAHQGLQLIDARIRSRLTSEARTLEEIAGYLLELGGKRVRPLLAVLSGKLFGMAIPSSQLVDAAAGIELIHMATLLHDDIIDASPKRRHKESAYSKYGFTSSLLAGDFLWVRAFGLCAHLGEFIVTATEKACIELTEGEVTEGTLRLDSPQSLSEYIEIVSKKTASLFSLSTSIGAHCAGASAANIERMRSFGEILGIAFQMVDDILDVTADEDLLGKPSGTDLKQRTPSLVNILWLCSGASDAREYFSASSVDEQSVNRALQSVRASAVLDEAREIARDYAERARATLAAVDEPTLDAEVATQLLTLLDFTLQRCL